MIVRTTLDVCTCVLEAHHNVKTFDSLFSGFGELLVCFFL